MDKVRPLWPGESAYRPAQKQHFWRYNIIFYLTWMTRKLLSLSYLTIAQHSTKLNTVSCWLEILDYGFGVRGTALKWFTSYISQRILQAQIKGTLSEKKQLTTGVLQGSWLGPVLFTIHVFDRFQIIERHFQKTKANPMMATKFTCHSEPFPHESTSVTAIEDCVAELGSWMIPNIPFVHEGEDQITPVMSVRNLGVSFDSNLKMDMRITKTCCQNAYYNLHNIKRIGRFLNQEAMCTTIHAFITSQIYYCNSLLNGLPDNAKHDEWTSW